MALLNFKIGALSAIIAIIVIGAVEATAYQAQQAEASVSLKCVSLEFQDASPPLLTVKTVTENPSGLDVNARYAVRLIIMPWLSYRSPTITANQDFRIPAHSTVESRFELSFNDIQASDLYQGIDLSKLQSNNLSSLAEFVSTVASLTQGYYDVTTNPERAIPTIVIDQGYTAWSLWGGPPHWATPGGGKVTDLVLEHC